MLSCKFAPGDWVAHPTWGGTIDHHVRIIQQGYDGHSGRPMYLTFDTTLSRGHGEFEWVWADELDGAGRLVSPAQGQEHLNAILVRVQYCRHLPYSLLDRTDCESLQRWIHSGVEQERYSPQVWNTVASVAGCLVIGALMTDSRNR